MKMWNRESFWAPGLNQDSTLLHLHHHKYILKYILQFRQIHFGQIHFAQAKIDNGVVTLIKRESFWAPGLHDFTSSVLTLGDAIALRNSRMWVELCWICLFLVCICFSYICLWLCFCLLQLFVLASLFVEFVSCIYFLQQKFMCAKGQVI